MVKNKPTPRFTWDSCVIIDAIQKTPKRWDHIQHFISDAEIGSCEIVVSTACIAELVHLGTLGEKGMPIDDQAKMIRSWLENPYVVLVDVQPQVAYKAAEIRRNTKIDGIDAIVIATAILSKSDTLHTYDDKKGTRKGLLHYDGQFPIGKKTLKMERPDHLAAHGQPTH